MGQAVGHAPHRDRRQGLRLLPRRACRTLPGRVVLGRRETMGRQAAPAALRPDAEARVGDHSRADRHADGADPSDRSFLRGFGRRRYARFSAGRRRARIPHDLMGDVRGDGKRAAGPLLVASSGHYSGIRHIHSSFEAHAHHGGAGQLPDAFHWKPGGRCRLPPTSRRPRASGRPGSKSSPGRSCWTATPAQSAAAAPTRVPPTSPARYSRRCTSWRT